MIYDKDKKIVLLLSPKTGTQTIKSIFIKESSNVKSFTCVYKTHTKYSDISKEYVDFNEENHSVYCFYREPVFRFLSTFKYFQRTIKKDMKNTHLEKIFVALYNDNDLSRNIDSITPSDIINALIQKRTNAPILDLFDPQIDYLESKVFPLNFHDFDNQIRFILDKFGLNSNIDIPKLNSTDSYLHIEELSAQNISDIKKIYSCDYEFFSKKRISFV